MYYEYVVYVYVCVCVYMCLKGEGGLYVCIRNDALKFKTLSLTKVYICEQS